MKTLSQLILSRYAIILLAIITTFNVAGQIVPTTANEPGAGTQPVNVRPSGYPGNTQVNVLKTWNVTRPIQLESDVLSTARTVQEIKQCTQYFDGLDRPLQTVTKAVSPNGYDIVTPVLYDAFGREVYKYLSYTSPENNGEFKIDPFLEQEIFLKSYFNASDDPNGEKYFYGKMDYESSPLNRVLKTYSPGNSWVGDAAGASTKYYLNTAADNIIIWNIGFNSGDVPVKSGIYADGRLYKTVVTDEHGKQVVEYKDKEAHILLKKAQLSNTPGADYTGWLCTYYVYDDLGNLRFVMQPKAVEYLVGHAWIFDGTNWSTSSIAKELCFSYEYDDQQRMIIKRVPGAGEISMVYDARDRLVMTQDANLRTAGKWLYTNYDELNRVVRTGLWKDANDRIYHLGQANTGITYPDPPDTNDEILTETYYDNYTWTTASGSGLKAAYINTFTNNTTYFYTPSNTNYPYPQPLKANYQARNQVTGTKAKVVGTPNAYVFSVSFYDDRGRVIQTQSKNYSGAKDTITAQYSFSGQVLRTLVAHAKGGINPQSYRVGTKNEFDAAGRLKKVYKKTANSPEVTIVENVYDENGQLKQKKLGLTVDESNTTSYAYTSTPVDVLSYSYNIRGWLRGINKDYARNENGGDSWFGMELCYDYGFTNVQLNGNISGWRWRSKGDGEQRAYGFTYDNTNRLKQADFSQQVQSNVWDDGTVTGISFSVSNLNYDANGNILSMRQKGLKAAGPDLIDDLSYGYVANSNKLNYVTDAKNDNSSVLGDFKEVNNNTTQDYWYDVNGNLAKDNNKSISSITYNHLNLPATISVAGKGTITYKYDANGNKIQKVTTDNTVVPAKVTVTTCTGLFVYQNDVLQFVNHEEGRTRPAQPGYGDIMYYDYFEKDHLGNVRIVLTDQIKQDIYPATTLEGDPAVQTSASFIEKAYYSINTNNIVPKSQATGITDYENNNGIYNNNPNSDNAALSDKLYKLTATFGGGVTGLGITLKVMAGDKIDIFGKSYYFQANTSQVNYNVPVLDILTGLLSSPAVAVLGKGVTAADLNGQSIITNAISGFLTDPDRSLGGAVGKPKAYINYIFFDEQFKFVKAGFSRIGARNVVSSHTNLQNVDVSKNGYVYVYVSNESPVAVFFDNLQLVHTRGPLLEETHYYPFGLTVSGISSKALAFGGSENKYKYNGKELQRQEFSDGSGLEWTDYGARLYDQQIGRWHKIDGKAELYFATSPYVYALNQPTHAIDPDGNLVIFINGMHDGDGGKAEYWTKYEKVYLGSKFSKGMFGGWREEKCYGIRSTRHFDEEVMDRIGDHHAMYKDGSNGGVDGIFGSNNLNAFKRQNDGYEQGKLDAESIITSLARDKSGNIIETIKIISHSMGGAYSKDYIRAILEYAKGHGISGVAVAFEADFAPFQPTKQKAVKDKNMGPTLQFSHKNDSVAGDESMPGAEKKDTSSDKDQIHSIHSFYNQILSLPAGSYKVIENKIVPQ